MTVSLSRSFPIETGVDLDFRPSSYIADWSATAAAVLNIVGDERRERVHQRMAAGARRAPILERLLADHAAPRPSARDSSHLIPCGTSVASTSRLTSPVRMRSRGLY
ncbi:hypothetical protein MASR1M101_36630 [Gemmatimonas sp.]